MVHIRERKKKDTTPGARQGDVREKKYAAEENNGQKESSGEQVSAKLVGDRDIHIHTPKIKNYLSLFFPLQHYFYNVSFSMCHSDVNTWALQQQPLSRSLKKHKKSELTQTQLISIVF